MAADVTNLEFAARGAAAGLAVVVGLWVAPPLRRLGPGLVALAGALVLTRFLPGAPAVGVALLVVATSRPRVQATLLAGAATAALLLGLPDDTPTGLVAVGAALLATAPVVVSRTSAGLPALAVPLTAISVGGIWLAVPDTEGILVIAGATTAALLLPRPESTAAAGTWLPLPSVVTFAAVTGAIGRAPALLGVTVCWGVLLVLPLADRARRNETGPRRAAPAVIVAVQLAAAAYGGRVAGHADGWGQAGALAAAGLLATATLLVAAARLVPERHGSVVS